LRLRLGDGGFHCAGSAPLSLKPIRRVPHQLFVEPLQRGEISGMAQFKELFLLEARVFSSDRTARGRSLSWVVANTACNE